MSLDTAMPIELVPSDTVALGILDAMPDATAILDRDGTIIAVNRTWRMFNADNGGDDAKTGVGVNYLDVCARSGAQGCSDAKLVATGIREVLAGQTVERDFEYACPSPDVGRWYISRITAIDLDPPDVMVSHINVTRRKMAEEDLERRASRDALTGLANRELFAQRLEDALNSRVTRTEAPAVGLLFIDLDRFKPVNDTYGHAAGDEVLQCVAARFLQVTRPHDTVARFGGDEFAIVAPRISPEGLASLVRRLEKALSEPYLVHGKPVKVGASVGSYLAAPGDDIQACLARADKAMYAVKRARTVAR